MKYSSRGFLTQLIHTRKIQRPILWLSFYDISSVFKFYFFTSLILLPDYTSNLSKIIMLTAQIILLFNKKNIYFKNVYYWWWIFYFKKIIFFAQRKDRILKKKGILIIIENLLISFNWTVFSIGIAIYFKLIYF